MPMKPVIRTGLCRCYHCGSENPVLLRNKAGKFCVRCTQCGHGSRWLNRDDAIIEWFNLFLYGPAQIKRIRYVIDRQREQEKAKEVIEEQQQREYEARKKKNATI